MARPPTRHYVIGDSASDVKTLMWPSLKLEIAIFILCGLYLRLFYHNAVIRSYLFSFLVHLSAPMAPLDVSMASSGHSNYLNC
jgi:hypothetical protein